MMYDLVGHSTFTENELGFFSPNVLLLELFTINLALSKKVGRGGYGGQINQVQENRYVRTCLLFLEFRSVIYILIGG